MTRRIDHAAEAALAVAQCSRLSESERLELEGTPYVFSPDSLAYQLDGWVHDLGLPGNATLEEFGVQEGVYYADQSELSEKLREVTINWLERHGYRRAGEALAVASQPVTSASSAYISPLLPSMIRNLWKDDPSERSVRTALKLAGDLIQELIDLRAKPVQVDEEKLAEVIEGSAGEWGDATHVPNVLAQYIAKDVSEWLRGDGAPEPEWQYCYVEKWVDGSGVSARVTFKTEAKAESWLQGAAEGVADWNAEATEHEQLVALIERRRVFEPGEWHPVERGGGQ